MSRATVSVDGEVVGRIASGLCVLVGVAPGDSRPTATHLAQRVSGLRIFADERGRMNRDLGAAGGAVLVVSQFTLYADTSRGRRPSFVAAGPAEVAADLCDAFAKELARLGHTVATGRFGAHMEVALVNDGPVTLVVSSGEPPWPADAG